MFSKEKAMALRPDEKFVADCLVKSLNAKMACEGEDPPDIYLDFGSERIAVEITRLSPVSFDEDGNMQNRLSQDSFGINICNDLDLSLRDEVPPKVDILLTLYVPVENPKKYKKELKEFMRHFIKKGIKASDKEEAEIAGSRVGISVIPNRDHSEKKIVGGIVNTNSNAHILVNAQATLAERVYDKVNKCKEIKHKGPVWLALFNDYWLADHDTYAQAISMLDMSHYFERIYVVMDTGFVRKIY
jgi:hypothetical protein